MLIQNELNAYVLYGALSNTSIQIQFETFNNIKHTSPAYEY